MVVNLRVMCKVALNDFGKVIWLSQIDSLPEELRTEQVVSEIKSQIDSEGCVEAELWTIMNIFGPYLNPANMPFRSTTIQLDKNPNFGNYFPKETEE